METQPVCCQKKKSIMNVSSVIQLKKNLLEKTSLIDRRGACKAVFHSGENSETTDDINMETRTRRLPPALVEKTSRSIKRMLKTRMQVTKQVSCHVKIDTDPHAKQKAKGKQRSISKEHRRSEQKELKTVATSKTTARTMKQSKHPNTTHGKCRRCDRTLVSHGDKFPRRVSDLMVGATMVAKGVTVQASAGNRRKVSILDSPQVIQIS